MTTLLVNINDEQEERVLLAFLNSLKYNYSTGVQSEELSEAQKEEILRREDDFRSGKIKAEPWEEVRKRFFHK
jgi:putative addiction module component (TIGR02574 family)